MSIKKWIILPHNEIEAKNFAQKAEIPQLLAALLLTRGITAEQAEAFFYGDSTLSDPFLLPDMQEAAERIQHALDHFEKIAVYGDYDADGVTATAMLYSYLESREADVVFYIPDREGEGYGLNLQAVDTLHAQGVKLIVTVDNGIASVEEVSHASSLGIDTVVTDHHRPGPVLPSACAVVDAWRNDNRCPFRDFSGAGIAFQLILALEEDTGDVQGVVENYADLAAIGTIGDIVPLTGENRALVKAGLEQIPHSGRPGLSALMERAGFEGGALTADNIAFVIVPRINAAGRIGTPERAVRLLTTDSMEEASALALEICGDNENRRKIEREIYEKALEQLRRQPELLYDRVLVLSGEEWHQGVIGIVASRVTERFGKPCVIISCSGEEAKGSGRSVEGFSLFEAVSSCRDLLTRFGGHPMAAGLSLPVKNIPAFRRQINEFAAASGQIMPVPVLKIDCALRPQELSVQIPEALDALEPCGTGNPYPLFALAGMTIGEITPVGGGKHLRISAVKNSCSVTCMKFRTTLEEFPFRSGDVVDLAVTLEAREFRGSPTLSVVVRDMRFSGLKTESLIRGKDLYEKFRRGEPLSPEEAAGLLPGRDEFAGIYRLLRSEVRFLGRPEMLLPRITGAPVPLGKLLVALDVLAEHRLIGLRKDADTYEIEILKTGGKVNLADSRTIHALNLYAEAGEQNGLAAQNL